MASHLHVQLIDTTSIGASDVTAGKHGDTRRDLRSPIVFYLAQPGGVHVVPYHSSLPYARNGPGFKHGVAGQDAISLDRQFRLPLLIPGTTAGSSSPLTLGVLSLVQTPFPGVPDPERSQGGLRNWSRLPHSQT